MNKQSSLLVLIIVILASAGYMAYRLSMQSNSRREPSTRPPVSLQTSEENIPTPTPVASNSASVIPHTETAYNQALASDKLVALYFYANWCPTCKLEFPVFEESISHFSEDDVIGIQVNFNDTETDDHEEMLAREFDVPYQHHKVFIKNGKVILSSPGIWDLDKYVSELSAALQ